MKGLFSQGVVILFAARPDLEDLQALLADYDLFSRNGDAPWPMGSPGFAVDYLAEANGKCIVEVCDRQWPDDMGHEHNDQEMRGAWAMGFFGPSTQPGALGRAVLHSRSLPDAERIARGHRVFVRLLLGYAMGGGPEARLATGGTEPVDELLWLVEVARCLLDHPDALCFFNPGGEVLLPAEFLDHYMQQWEEKNLPPFEATINFRLRDIEDPWLLIDTVGLAQFDVPDQESAFNARKFSPADIVNFHLNLALYLLDDPDAIQTGNTADGPGGKWRAEVRDESVFDPPRSVLHWTCDSD